MNRISSISRHRYYLMALLAKLTADDFKYAGSLIRYELERNFGYRRRSSLVFTSFKYYNLRISSKLQSITRITESSVYILQGCAIVPLTDGQIDWVTFHWNSTRIKMGFLLNRVSSYCSDRWPDFRSCRQRVILFLLHYTSHSRQIECPKKVNDRMLNNTGTNENVNATLFFLTMSFSLLLVNWVTQKISSNSYLNQKIRLLQRCS